MSLLKNIYQDDIRIELERKIQSWMSKYLLNKLKHRVNDDGTIDVLGDIILPSDEFEELPDYIKFNKCYGNFSFTPSWYIQDDAKRKDSIISSLRGLPWYVEGDLDLNVCYKIKSLDGLPKEVGGCLICSKWKKFTRRDVTERCLVRGSIIMNVSHSPM